jgi:hypothetical protein
MEPISAAVEPVFDLCPVLQSSRRRHHRLLSPVRCNSGDPIPRRRRCCLKSPCPLSSQAAPLYAVSREPLYAVSREEEIKKKRRSRKTEESKEAKIEKERRWAGPERNKKKEMEMRRDRKKRSEPEEATGWLLQTNKEKQEEKGKPRKG